MFGIFKFVSIFFSTVLLVFYFRFNYPFPCPALSTHFTPPPRLLYTFPSQTIITITLLLCFSLEIYWWRLFQFFFFCFPCYNFALLLLHIYIVKKRLLLHHQVIVYTPTWLSNVFLIPVFNLSIRFCYRLNILLPRSSLS